MTDKYWTGPVPKLDDFDQPITNRFIDGTTRIGCWAIMTPKSFELHGRKPLGTGRGQLYEKTTIDGKVRWMKIDG